MTIGNFRADLELPELDTEDVTAEQVVNSINRMANYLNFLTKNISLQSNFNCYIAQVSIPATSNVAVQHFLGVVPRYRIILRQEGNGVISDIPSGWTTDVITLRNDGAVAVKITVMIVRE
jgi:hypothetical protein